MSLDEDSEENDRTSKEAYAKVTSNGGRKDSSSAESAKVSGDKEK